MITSIVSMLPIYLYSEDTGKTEAIEDNRVRLLNDDTGDLLDGTQFKAALIEDYLLSGAGYAYVHWLGKKVKSIHYVRNAAVGVQKNADPMFKTATLNVQGRTYEPEYFMRMLNNSQDGVTGRGIVDVCNEILQIARESLNYEKTLVKTGGNKKGFLQSKSKLADDALQKVKAAWSKFWSNPNTGAIVLNDGMTFLEASATSVEMQLNEHKRTNAAEISKLLNIPPSVLEGTATGETLQQMMQTAIIPILTAFESACNRALLLESEKGKLYFAFDTKELFKGNTLARFQAYEVAIRNGFMQVDEVRFREDLPPLGFNFLRLGLQDVYYDPDSGVFYTPNTDKMAKLDGGGLKIER
ncbi:MAG: phage portal protein [Christensenellaceae bacterium]|nr:phage portal protein [Christensenellaceae bacterium]